MSRTQLRAKIGAASTVRRVEGAGEKAEVPAAGNTQITNAGAEDKICWEAPVTIAARGAEGGVESVWQHAISQRHPQSQADALAYVAAGAAATAACAQRNIKLHRMEKTAFTFQLSPYWRWFASRILGFSNHLLVALSSVLSAARTRTMYFSGSLSNFFLQDLQHNFTSWFL